MDFDITVDHLGRFTVVKVCGDVDLHTAPSLRMSIDEVLSSGWMYVAVDLEDCKYFDSDGLKALIKALRAVEGRGKLVICGARGVVSKVLDISGLSTIIPIFPSVVHLLDDDDDEDEQQEMAYENEY